MPSPRVAALLVLALLLLTGASSQAPQETPIEGALRWLAASDLRNFTAYKVEAVAAAGIDPAAWPDAQASVLAALEAQERDANPPVRALHAFGAAGYERPDLAGQVLSNASGGGFGGPDTPPWNAFAILALRAAGVPASDARVQAAADRLLSLQGAAGGWGTTSSATAAPATDETGFALAALKAAGRDVSGNVRAATFLNATHVQTTGGHAAFVGTKANCQSTVWALHGYAALGMAPFPDDITFLEGLRERASGGVKKQAADLKPDEMCTAEAAVVFAGARYPLPGIVPPSLVARAMEETTLSLPADYTAARWRFEDGAEAQGVNTTYTFVSVGPHEVWLDAWGPRAIHRGPTIVQVLSQPPVAVVPPELAAWRRDPVTLDPRGSYDVDGWLQGVIVDWGDGNATRASFAPVEHAYDLPGEYAATVRVTDDSGDSSAPANVTIRIANRAPVLSLPARVTADRASDLVLRPDAADPEGDALDVAWTGPQGSGTGEARLRLDALGNATVRFVARDPYGGEATRDVLVEVVNLPPRLADVVLPSPVANETFTLEARASDADGPAPSIAWRVGSLSGEGDRFVGALPAGEHAVEVAARDADGAVETLRGTLVVRLPDAPALDATVALAPDEPEAPPLRFDAAPAIVEADEPVGYALAHVEDAEAYRFDFGDGSSSGWIDEAEVSHAWSKPGTYEVRATVRTSDGRTSTATYVVAVMPAEAPPRPAAPSPLPAAPEVKLPPRSPPPQAPQEAARREAPAPGALLALLLAGLGTRARRGAR